MDLLSRGCESRFNHGDVVAVDRRTVCVVQRRPPRREGPLARRRFPCGRFGASADGPRDAVPTVVEIVPLGKRRVPKSGAPAAGCANRTIRPSATVSELIVAAAPATAGKQRRRARRRSGCVTPVPANAALWLLRAVTGRVLCDARARS